MKVVGLDLSGPRNIADTCLVSFEAQGDEIHLLSLSNKNIGAETH
jgi:hypothetical protein